MLPTGGGAMHPTGGGAAHPTVGGFAPYRGWIPQNPIESHQEEVEPVDEYTPLEPRDFTLEELKEFNGEGDKPVLRTPQGLILKLSNCHSLISFIFKYNVNVELRFVPH